MDNLDYITTGHCDACRAENVPVVIVHDHMDTPVLAECVQCGTRRFDNAARTAIDAWLETGSTQALGRAA